MKVCLFEDGKEVDFFPLTMTRAVYELRCGRTTLLEKLVDAFGKGAEVCLHSRDYLTDVLRERYPGYLVNSLGERDDVLFVNGRWLYKGEQIDLKDEYVGMSGDQIVLIKAKKETVKKYWGLPIPEIVKKLSEELGRDTVKANLAQWPWDLVFANPEMIKYDFERLGKRGIHGKVHGHVEIVGDKDMVYVAPTAKIYPYAVIDAEEGPVIIDEGVVVYSFAFIQGPSSIGESTYVMMGAKVREGFTAGPVCRVGGEVEESIIHGYSNKYHDGFLGHAYVGEWVNLGALTTNSDLKNTYGTVRFGPRRLDTGRQKVGVFIADMVKTSVGTFLYTGKSVGVASHLHGTVAEDVPSFTIYARSLGVEPVELDLESALKTLERMMGRRGLTPTNAMRRLLERVFHITERERLRAGVKRGRFSLQLLGTAP